MVRTSVDLIVRCLLVGHFFFGGFLGFLDCTFARFIWGWLSMLLACCVALYFLYNNLYCEGFIIYVIALVLSLVNLWCTWVLCFCCCRFAY